MLASIGYEGIEIMADVPHAYPENLTNKDVERIRGLLDEYGLEVSNINAFTMHAVGDTWHPSWIEANAGERRKRLDHTLSCVEMAWQLGARTISTEPGGPLQGMTRDQGINLFLEGLSHVAPRARQLGIRILIEPEPGLLLEKSNEFLEFYEYLDPQVFGLNFDIGHFYCVGEDPASLVEPLKTCTFHYHLEDIAASRVHEHLALGHGVLDIPSVLRAVRASGYNGFVTVELYPYQHDPAQVARDAITYLRSLNL